MMYIKRDAEAILLELTQQYPVISITGPRQSGKTTLSRTLFKKKKYISLEDLEQREYANKDPKGFLSQSSGGMIIDEAQLAPLLFSYIQVIVDDSRRPGEFILTGSQQFDLMSGINQSLAGRVGLVELLPFSTHEVYEQLGTIENVLYKGFYPPLYDRSFRPHVWYKDYVRTYIERDVRKLINVKDLSLFQKFIALCAARVGQLINFSELSSATGVDVRTVKSWISVLEASYIIFLLRPYHKNFSKRLVKMPKLYFYDSGLLCHLLQIRADDLILSPYKGSIFESMVISEVKKINMNHRKDLELYFWRDHKGVEIDLLFEKHHKIYPVEIKSGQTIQQYFFKNLKLYQKYIGLEHGKSFLVYGGGENQKRTYGEVLSWTECHKIFDV